MPQEIEGEGKAEYKYGCTVTGLRDVADKGIEVEYEDRDGKTSTTIADMVIGTDGPSSTVRKILLPDVKRKHAGYIAWQGTVPKSEASVSVEAKEAFFEKFAFPHSRRNQILAYVIPGENSAPKPGKRLINGVWCCNYSEGSKELKELMTGTDGKAASHHHSGGGDAAGDPEPTTCACAENPLPTNRRDRVLYSTIVHLGDYGRDSLAKLPF